jgi:nucleoside-diphosphate-sugar epimerase
MLLVGGSGYVGSMVTPYLREEHELRVFDIAPPKDSSVEYFAGSVNDGAAVRAALDGIEGVAYMAMGRTPDGSYDVRSIDSCYDLHVKGLHRVLDAARAGGLTRAVYTSSLSVHGSRHGGRVPNEDIPCDAPDLYGFTKWLGELVCEYFARAHGMTVISLRLHGPVTREEWQRRCRPGHPNPQVAAPDLASAISLGLTAPAAGFHTLSISGDYEGTIVNCARAKQVLGWEPKERPEPPRGPEAQDR